tara:strand:- start:1633 stop:1980 length:348 start_codon:yes stop_codon:yes gene_type:complete
MTAKKTTKITKGRPSFKPTKEQKSQVTSMSGYGLTADQICAIIDVSRGTLFKYFQKELKEGEAKALGRVSQKAFEMAVSGNQPAMTMFYLKCRGKWTERIAVASEDLPPIVVSSD